MNRLSAINNTKTLAMSILAVFLLLAPCSVRNNLENILGVPATKPLSPNKSTATCSLTCSVGSVTANAVQKQGESVNKTGHIHYSKDYSALIADENQWTTTVIETAIPYTSPPYYILYKRLKVYDLKNAHSV